MVPFNQVFKLVARLDSQCFANLTWNGCLSLTRYRGMLHRIVPYSIGFPYILILPYFTSLGKRLLSIARRWPSWESTMLVMKLRIGEISIPEIERGGSSVTPLDVA